MKYTEAPTPLKNLERPLVFLAGGITNCEDWQKRVVEGLKKEGIEKGTILNPRRAEFPIHDPSAAREQILWEQEALWLANIISIWFAGGPSVQPIVMFELGCHLGRFCIGGGPDRLLVGVDPGYRRKQDVYIQLEAHSRNLNGPWKITPCDSLNQHIKNIAAALRSKSR